MRTQNINTSRVSTIVTKDVAKRFKGKAHFYCLTEREVLQKLIGLFTDTEELNKYLGIPYSLEK